VPYWELEQGHSQVGSTRMAVLSQPVPSNSSQSLRRERGPTIGQPKDDGSNEYRVERVQEVKCEVCNVRG
jgi:hypothetical protein